MPRLDVGTLAFCAAIVSIAAGVIIAAFGSARRGNTGDGGAWRWFAAATLGYGIGLLAVLAPLTQFPSPWLLLAGNTLVMLSAIAAYAGAAFLAGRRPWVLLCVGLGLGFIAAESWFIFVQPSINARIAMVSLFRVPLLGLGAALVLRAYRAKTDRTSRGLSGRPLVATILGGWAALLLLRAAEALLVQGPIDDFPALQGIQALYYLAAGLGGVGIAVALIRIEAARVAESLSGMLRRQTLALQDQIERHAQARRLIHAQLSLHDAMLDTLPSPLFAKSVGGEYLQCNTAFEQAMGQTRQNLVGRTAFDITDPLTSARHIEADRRVLAGEGPQTYEAPFRFADGRTHQVLVSKSVFRDSDGAVAGIVGSLTDISQLTRVTEDLRAILDNMTDVFYRSDRDGRLLMLSRSVEMVIGWRAEDLIGRPTASLIVDPETRPALFAAMERGGGSVTDFEFQARHRDGSAVWLSASARFRFDETGAVDGTEGTLRLIEERKRAEASIQESQALIQTLLNCSTDATMLFGADGILLACNRVTAERLGRTVEDLIGGDLWAMFPPEVGKRRREITLGVLETGTATTLVDRRGGLVLHNTIHPVLNAQGQPVRVAVFSRDITAQTAAEERLARHVAEIERSNAELEQFAYVASHDLREPLRMISSYMTLIERRYADRLDEDGIEFLGYAREGALRMDRLVLDLLDFSRIGRGAPPMSVVEIAPLIERTLAVLAPLIDQAEARIDTDLGTLPPVVLGDPDQLGRLLQNLIGNALKYRTPERGVEIRITATRQAGDWLFTISDNGIGIEAEHFERIFRIFQRLHTQDRFEGTGIGLAICRKIVERHGGRIWVESDPGVGSTFSFTLPAAPDRA